MDENKIMDENAQHFNVWRAFNLKVYQKTLTADHIMNNGNEKFIDRVTMIQKLTNGRYQEVEGKLVGTKCIFIEKDGKKYIAPASYQDFLPFNPVKTYECYLKKNDTTVYIFIEDTLSVKITPTKTLKSFKDLISIFNPIPHTHPTTWTFLKIQAIGSKAKGGKYRLCSKPETGKNANDVILNAIFNDNVRVSTPTLPKLETLFYFNQKVLPDEMTSMTSSQVRDVEPFFLTIADEDPTFQKHSMASNKNMNNVDITSASCVFTYNDPASLAEDAKFFDDIWQNPTAFDSRYPALYVEGKTLSDKKKLSMPQATIIMENNFDKLRLIAKNIAYYVQNMHLELKGWDRSKCILTGRKRVNFEAVIDALDVYSDTQEEFDEWIEYVNNSVRSYKELVNPKITVFNEFVPGTLKSSYN